MQQKNELPEGWVSAKLNEGCLNNIQTGFACGVNNKNGEGVPHLRPMNISRAGCIDLSVLKYIPSSKVDNESKLVTRGDVIFNNTNSPDLVGKTAFYDLSEPQAFSNHMTRLRCNLDILDPVYCTFFLNELWKNGYFKSNCNNHVSQSSISRDVLLNTVINVPPLPEQHRIVTLIETLLSRLDATNERLDIVSETMETFRQAILKIALQGKMVPQDSRSEVASKLVENIKEDLIKNKIKENKLIPIDLEENLYELPDSWKWIRLGEILTFGPKNGYSPKPSKTITNVRALTLTATTSGKFRDDCFKYIDEEIDTNSYLWLKENDILIQRGNTI